MINKTEDYSIFKKHENNRDIVESNVIKIMKSIQIKNLLNFRPILVNQRMEIIDGQHRLEAAKRLKIPVFYEMSKTVNTEDIILLNDNQKGWSREDFLNYYCGLGFEHYLKLKALMKRQNTSVSIALALVGKGSSGAHTITKDGYAALFKKGKFVYPSAYEEIELSKTFDQSNEILEYIKRKSPVIPKYIFGSRFRRSLLLFLSIKSVDFEIFKDKLEHRLDLIRNCATVKDHIIILKKIYNWKNRTPIAIDEEYQEIGQ